MPRVSKKWPIMGDDHETHYHDRCSGSKSENRECKQKPQKSVRSKRNLRRPHIIYRSSESVGNAAAITTAAGVLRNPAREDDLYEIHSMAACTRVLGIGYRGSPTTECTRRKEILRSILSYLFAEIQLCLLVDNSAATRELEFTIS